MSLSKKKKLVLLAGVLVCLSLAGPSHAQTLYGVLESTEDLRVLDPSDASTIAILGTITHPNGATLGRAIALDATTGTLYATFPIGGGTWVFGTLGFDASFSEIAVTPDAIRDMVFDASGKLWAVVGNMGPNANDLVSVNTSTGAITLENGALPTTGRNKLAYVATSDTLYLLGDTDGPWQLYSFSPATPTDLTQVPLSGIVLDDMNQPPMAYDPAGEVLRTQDTDGNWVAITLGGVVTLEAPFLSNLGGLAFDGPFFSDGFESGDTLAWSSTVG